MLPDLHGATMTGWKIGAIGAEVKPYTSEHGAYTVQEKMWGKTTQHVKVL